MDEILKFVNFNRSQCLSLQVTMALRAVTVVFKVFKSISGSIYSTSSTDCHSENVRSSFYFILMYLVHKITLLSVLIQLFIAMAGAAFGVKANETILTYGPSM